MSSRLGPVKFDAIRACWEDQQRNCQGTMKPTTASSRNRDNENDGNSQNSRRFRFASPLKPLGTNPFVRRRQNTIIAPADATALRSFSTTKVLQLPGGVKARSTSRIATPTRHHGTGSSANAPQSARRPPRLPRSNTTSNLPIPRRSEEQEAGALILSQSSTQLPRPSAAGAGSVPSVPQPWGARTTSLPVPQGERNVSTSTRKPSAITATTPVQRPNDRLNTPGTTEGLLRTSRISRPSLPAKLPSSHNITQHQLLQPLRPPTPKTPRTATTEAGYAADGRKVSTGPFRRHSEVSPCHEVSTPTVIASRVTRQVSA